MSELVITDNLEGRLDALCRLERACFSDPWSREALESSLSASYCLPFGALLDGELAGYALVYCIADRAELVNIAVAPECRRKGVGRALLAAAVRGAARVGGELIELELRSSNTAARRLYEAAGFRVTGSRRGYYTAPREDALLMTLELDGCRSGDGSRANFQPEK